MPTTGQTEARKLHGSLSHPIIDADELGHGQDWARRKTYRNTTAVTPAKA